VRRLLVLVLGSAIFISACGSSAGTVTPAATPTATPVPTASPTVKITIAPTAAPDAAWIVWAPAGAGFTSKFPATPKLSTTTTKTAAGDAPSSTWTYQQGTTLAFYVTVANYPKGSMTGKAPSTIFDDFINGMTTDATGLKVDSKTPVTLGSHDGEAFKLSSTEGSIQGQVFLVGDDLYVVYAAYLVAVTDMTPIDTFIADFALTV
jgi:hypothetical protein